jgi:Icc-related predicted phosphoesterase
MKIVAISDTHLRHRGLKLPKADVIIHAGDITLRGRASEVTDFLDWFAGLNYAHKIFIAGNHDFFLEKSSPAAIAQMLPEGVTYLKDSGTQINGLKFWGSPVTPWFFNWAFNRHRGAPLRHHWNMIPADTDVLITHGPPYGILDQVGNQLHVGCKDLVKKVEEIKPKVHVFGHIHESYGFVKKSSTRFYNASITSEAQELLNKPIVFEV